MSLLTICQNAARESGLAVPSTIVANTELTAQRLYRLANREGHNLSRRAPGWQVLVTEGSITLATSTQTYALPTDFRYLYSDTMWNRNTDRPVVIPLRPAQWQASKGIGLNTGIDLRLRVIGGQFVVDQTVTSDLDNQVLYYDYVSTKWASTSGGTAQAAFSADSDLGRLDEELLTLGVVWRIKKSLGLEWEGDFAEYEQQVSLALGREGARRTVSMSATTATLGVVIPDRGFG